MWSFPPYPCILKFLIMAKANLNFTVSGKLGELSMYQMKGIDHLIIRAKGGPTSEQIKSAPEFARVRENNSEFSAVGKSAGMILNACYGIKHLTDYFFMGPITRLCKIIQKRDDTHLRGQRSILFSKYGQLFEGLNTCQANAFDTVVKQSPSCLISRADCKATMSFPELLPNINLVNPWNNQLYRFVVVLGIVPDMVFGPYGYAPVIPVTSSTQVSFTPWYSAAKGSKRQEVEMQIVDAPLLSDGLTLWVSVGIEFGAGISTSVVEPVKRVGCGKVLMVG